MDRAGIVGRHDRRCFRRPTAFAGDPLDAFMQSIGMEKGKRNGLQALGVFFTVRRWRWPLISPAAGLLNGRDRMAGGPVAMRAFLHRHVRRNRPCASRGCSPKTSAVFVIAMILLGALSGRAVRFDSGG